MPGKLKFHGQNIDAGHKNWEGAPGIRGTIVSVSARMHVNSELKCRVAQKAWGRNETLKIGPKSEKQTQASPKESSVTVTVLWPGFESTTRECKRDSEWQFRGTHLVRCTLGSFAVH